MPKDNNPASRLLQILQQAMKHPDSKTIIEVWVSEFRLNAQDTHEIFRRLAQLVDLTNEIEGLIKRIPDPDIEPDLYLRDFPSIRKGLSHPSLSNPWGTIRASFSPEHLRGLEFCADLLARRFPESNIPQADLDAISHQVDELFRALKDSKIDPKLRALLLDLLETIRRCIAEYQIRGAKGIRETITTALDTLSEHVRKKPKASFSEEERTILSRFLDTLSKADEVVSRSLTYLPLLQKIPGWVETIKGLLPHG